MKSLQHHFLELTTFIIFVIFPKEENVTWGKKRRFLWGCRVEIQKKLRSQSRTLFPRSILHVWWMCVHSRGKMIGWWMRFLFLIIWFVSWATLTEELLFPFYWTFFPVLSIRWVIVKRLVAMIFLTAYQVFFFS